jgi:hypothetical protein
MSNVNKESQQRDCQDNVNKRPARYIVESSTETSCIINNPRTKDNV